MAAVEASCTPGHTVAVKRTEDTARMIRRDRRRVVDMIRMEKAASELLERHLSTLAGANGFRKHRCVDE